MDLFQYKTFAFNNNLIHGRNGDIDFLIFRYVQSTKNLTAVIQHIFYLKPNAKPVNRYNHGVFSDQVIT